MGKKKTAYTWIESRGKYRRRVKIGDKWHDVYGVTGKEIEAKVKELEKAHDTGLALNDKTKLVNFARDWFTVKTAGLSVNTAVMYKNAINVHIAPFFGNLKLSEVKPLHIQKLLASKAELSFSSQSKILLTLSQIFESAVTNGLIVKNPCRGIKAGGEHAKIKTPLTFAQQAELSNAVHGTRAELFVLLCLYAGLRREEALGLTWGSVHLDGVPYIEVKHAVTFDKNRPKHTDRLKSDKAYRSIPIPPILSDALKKARYTTNSTLVINAVKSKSLMSLSAFNRMWSFAVRAVDFYIHPHLLRHTYITELCASGMDIKKIQYLAGHEDVTMTLRIYTHVKENTPEDLAPHIIKTFSGVKPGVRKYKLKRKP